MYVYMREGVVVSAGGGRTRLLLNLQGAPTPPRTGRSGVLPQETGDPGAPYSTQLPTQVEKPRRQVSSVEPLSNDIH